MQHDEIIWSVINHQFCSFKSKIAGERTFCRNEYNVTGLCSRSSCPLANSSYATIRETDGVLHLYVKTVERAHSPKNLWEKIKLSRDYGKAIAQLDEHLEYMPKFLMHRNKQRLTKIHQYLIRMRKLELKTKPKMVGIHKKIEVREDRREIKALKAARIEKHVEAELLERLKSGSYGDIYNFPENSYNKVLGEQINEDGEAIEELENEEEAEEEGLVEFVEDFEESDDEEDGMIWPEDMEDAGNGMEGSDGDSSENDEEDDSEDDDEDSNSEDKPAGSDEDEEPKTKKSKPKPPKKDISSAKRKADSKKKKPAAKKGRMEIEYEEENEGEMAW